MNILIVDDEQDVELLFRQRFRKEVRDGEVGLYFAFNGEQALELLAQSGETGLVLVLSDINMPGMDGLELLRRTKSKFPSMKVFMITAYGDDQNVIRANEYGADRFITKPLDFDLLKKEIHTQFREIQEQ